jgi:hypothetical protein
MFAQVEGGRCLMAKLIYVVKIGLLDPTGGWGLDVGQFETMSLEEAEEVASFFKKKDYLVNIFKMERLEEVMGDVCRDKMSKLWV